MSRRVNDVETHELEPFDCVSIKYSVADLVVAGHSHILVMIVDCAKAGLERVACSCPSVRFS